MSMFLGSLPNLEVLKLKEDACQGREWDTTAGQFLKLKILEIEDRNLEIWSMESSSHLPALQQLKLSYCRMLKELPSCMEEMDTLELIEVTNSHKNVDEWAEDIFKQHDGNGNESFQLMLVPALSIEPKEEKVIEEDIMEMEQEEMKMIEENITEIGEPSSPPRLVITTSSAIDIHSEEEIMSNPESIMWEIHGVIVRFPFEFKIISIVGMGGIGKTTIARTIYRDNKVSQLFDVRLWVTVSQIYDARTVLLSLLNAGKEENQEFSNEELAERVYRSLESKSYLIIVDDIWDTHGWDDIKKLLPHGRKGSRVVLTTRQTDVAIYAGSYIYNVPRMDKDTSWKLLEKKVFRGDSFPPTLVDIGISIADKCIGLPLTIVVIAGLLRVDQTPAFWKNIAQGLVEIKEREYWKRMLAMHKNDEYHVLDILSLSYTHLPDWMKPCLLYFGRFPEDQQISASNLIKLWVAEGFLGGYNSLEECGYECLEELIKRNIISTKRKLRSGLPNKCFVHDVIREMCIRLSGGNINPRGVIFLSMRGAFYITGQQSHRLKDRYESFTLKVLDATLEEKVEFPPTFSQLVNLKYLSLRCSVDSLKIPTNLCMFTKLKTLVIYLKNVSDVRLPPEIWKIPKLKHLIIAGEGILDYVDSESEASLPLERLETLLHIRIENSSVRILERIPNIRKLGFKYFQGSMHFIEHIVHLHHLESLYLVAAPREDYAWQQDRIFPNSLRKLKMEDVKLPWEYVCMFLGSLPNLEVLKLKEDACQGREWDTAAGKFLKLKILEIEDRNLKIWKMESSSHLPALQQLKLSYCQMLKELPSCMEEMDTLELIEVTNSHKNVDEWAEDIFKQHHDSGNELFQLLLVPALGKQPKEAKVVEEDIMEKEQEEMKMIQEGIVEKEQKKAKIIVVVGEPSSRPQFAITTSSVIDIHSEADFVSNPESIKWTIWNVIRGSSFQLKIISLMGIGGIGKTTIARTIYLDNKVLQLFDVRIWVTVSQIYDARSVLLSLLNAGKEENQEFSNEELAERVYRSLESKSYLIIVDDIWDTHSWDDIKKLLPHDHKGSRIVLTTRQTDVAVYAGSYIYNIPRMDKDTSWKLLEKKVFRGDSCPPTLVDIGISIADKCLGLPLTIVVIAGLLRVNQTPTWWKNIAKGVKLAMDKHAEDHVLDILSLSHIHLPDWMKPCLLYLGRFPEGQQISVTNLIKLWVAEGFLELRGYSSLEECGYECLEELINRNLISTKRKRRNGLPNKCFVHDLIREMCIRLSKGIYNPVNINFLWIRGALYFTSHWGFNKLVRVLDASLEVNDVFPYSVDKVGELVQLGYLSVCCSVDFVFTFPTNICRFTNLETLIIHSKYDLPVKLPSEIWEMHKLKHLLICGGGILEYVHSEIEASLPLESLETLLHIRIENSSVRILEMIPNIRKLGLNYFQCSMHCIVQLVNLHHLESLYMRGNPVKDYVWLQNHIFPYSLRKLKMEDVKLPWKYFGRILGALPKLEVLKLKNDACQGREWETVQGHFLKLKVLEFEDRNLEIWRMESSSHLPVLELLRLSYCLKLKELPWCMGEMEALELIEVTNSHKNVDEWAEGIFELTNVLQTVRK